LAVERDPTTAPAAPGGPTACPLDCPDTCELAVDVRKGRISAIRAAGNGDGGFICGKVAGFARRQYHDDRIRHPLRRTGSRGGSFERIGWDDAIELIVDRFETIRRESGGEAILPFHYGGSNGLLTDGSMDRAFFARLGASRLLKTVCAVPTTEVATGMYGRMPGVAFEDVPRAKSIVIWGANPRASSIHLIPRLRAARERGAFIAAIDPRKNFSDREIDLHLPVLPGTDLPLALGLIRWWCEHDCIDRAFVDRHTRDVDILIAAAMTWPMDRVAAVTGVPVNALVTLAERFAAATPALIRCGWGPERNRNGGQAIAAILAIPALLGKFGVRGGGYLMSNGGGTRVRPSPAVTGRPWETRTINMSSLGSVLTDPPDPPVRALFVYNANPVATLPDQRRVLEGLAREDLFVVVHDQVMTDTAALADVVLPATTFLEHDDLRVSYGRYVFGRVRPVVEAEGEARSNAWVFASLARALGWDEEPFTWSPSEFVQHVVNGVTLGGTRVHAEVMGRGGVQAYDFAGATPVQFVTVQPRTPDGFVHLAPEVLGPNPYEFLPSSPDLPLAMISPASSRLVSSTFGESNLRRLVVDIHPTDAVPRGIGDAQPVWVFNAQGEVHCHARVTPRVRPGVVSMPKGAWRRSSGNGLTATALCPAHLNVVGGAACYNDARVDVRPA